MCLYTTKESGSPLLDSIPLFKSKYTCVFTQLQIPTNMK